MSNEQPKKRPRSKRLNVNKKQQWEKILKDVRKDEVPVDVLESITVNLKDGTSVFVDIKELLAEGNTPQELEEMINSKLTALDEYIEDVDFYISVDSVAKTVQPITDKILKNL